MHRGLRLDALRFCFSLEMPYSMSLHITFLCKTRRAYIARVRSYTIVYAFVDSQMRLPHKLFSTHVALVLAIFHRKMRLNMHDQVLLVTINAIENVRSECRKIYSILYEKKSKFLPEKFSAILAYKVSFLMTLYMSPSGSIASAELN